MFPARLPIATRAFPVLLVASLLCACGGDGGGNPDQAAATPTSSAVAATPTGTPTRPPDPTATATAIDDPQLRTLEPLAVSPEIAAYGRDVFENDTFGNEAFWTGIVGILNGTATVNGTPVSLLSDLILPAIDALDGAAGNLFDCPGGVCNGGAFTTNLTLTIPPGTAIDDGRLPLPAGPFPTGLAVLPGHPVPVGVVPVEVESATPGSVATPLNAPGSAFAFGVSCALCHTTVGSDGGKIDGLPNKNLQVGVLFALAQNSAALFPLSGVKPSDLNPFAGGSFDGDGDGVVDAGKQDDFEVAVDASFLNLPRGYFDATPDARLDPTQIPHVIAEANGPYLWDGLFPRLRDLANFVHVVDLDLTSLAPLAATLGLAPDEAAFTANLYQRSPASRDPRLATFDAYDALWGNTPDVPGVLRLAVGVPSGIASLPFVALPAHGVTGYRAVRTGTPPAGLDPADAAMDASERFQRSLRGVANESPANRAALASGAVRRGARISEQAGCVACHAAPGFNVNGDGDTITPLAAIATQPARALFGADLIKVGGNGFQAEVGYKNQSHRFVFATAPYLHDGGIAAADTDGDGEADVFGVVDTLLSGIEPQPRASLQALLDPVLKSRCVAANRERPNPLTGVPPADVHITGEGHDFFVAEGVPRPGGGTFTRQDREDLIAFLLALDDEPGR